MGGCTVTGVENRSYFCYNEQSIAKGTKSPAHLHDLAELAGSMCPSRDSYANHHSLLNALENAVDAPVARLAAAITRGCR